jgi:hypothetical protein
MVLEQAPRVELELVPRALAPAPALKVLEQAPRVELELAPRALAPAPELKVLEQAPRVELELGPRVLVIPALAQRVPGLALVQVPALAPAQAQARVPLERMRALALALERPALAQARVPLERIPALVPARALREPAHRELERALERPILDRSGHAEKSSCFHRGFFHALSFAVFPRPIDLLLNTPFLGNGDHFPSSWINEPGGGSSGSPIVSDGRVYTTGWL